MESNFDRSVVGNVSELKSLGIEKGLGRNPGESQIPSGDGRKHPIDNRSHLRRSVEVGRGRLADFDEGFFKDAFPDTARGGSPQVVSWGVRSTGGRVGRIPGPDG